MSNIPENLFKTNEFAKLCGVNKKTLLYYDSIGLFCPCFVAENGYRYYSYQQYELFGLITALKEINMPLNEIKNFIVQRSPEHLINTLTTQKEFLNARIKRLIHTCHMIETVINVTEEAQSIDPSIIYLENMDEEYLTLSDPIKNYDKKSFIEIISNHIQYCNDYHISDGYPIGGMLTKDNILNERFTDISHLFTKTSIKHPTIFSFIKPKGLYAVGFHVGDYQTTPSTYERLLKFIKENHLSVYGNSYEETLLDYLSHKDPTYYVTKISIQVSKL